MKTRFLVSFFLLGFATLRAETFTGLRSVLSAAEWKRAGLDQLTPDQIGVIDAALIRQQAGVNAVHEAAIVEARTTAVTAARVETPENKPPPRDWLQRFGLPTWNGPDWRSIPPMKAKVLSWDGGNRFKLDNGQVWEGFEAIPYDLPGHDVEIAARPNDQFQLTVDGKKTTIRIMRLR